MSTKFLIPVAILCSFSAQAKYDKDTCISGDCQNGNGVHYIWNGYPGFIEEYQIGTFKNGLLEGNAIITRELNWKYNRYYSLDTLKGTFKDGQPTGIFLKTSKYWKMADDGSTHIPEYSGAIATIIEYKDERTEDWLEIYDDGRLEPHFVRKGKSVELKGKKAQNQVIREAAAKYLASAGGGLRHPQEDIANKIVTLARNKWVQCLSWNLVADERAYSGDFFNQTKYKQPPFGARYEYRVENAKGEVIFTGASLQFRPRESGMHTIYIKYQQDIVGGGSSYVDAYNIQWYFAATWPRPK